MDIAQRLDETRLRIYLEKHWSRITALRDTNIGAIEEVTRNTNSSFVFRVEIVTRDKPFFVYVKWSPPYAKAFPEITMESGRVIVEGEFLQKAGENRLLANYLPKVLWLDKENRVLVMTDVLRNGTFLHDILERYKIYPWLGEEFGRFFEVLHNAKLNFRVPSNHQRWWIGVGFRKYMTLGGQKVLGEKEVLALIDESERVAHTVIWADPMPKNIVIDGRTFRLMDFETVIDWDIAYDIGTFISHFAIRWVLRPSLHDNFNKFLDELFVIYKIADPETKQRIMKYVAVFMVHRTDGIDQYSFTEEEKEVIRAEAKKLFDFNGKLYNLIAKNIG